MSDPLPGGAGAGGENRVRGPRTGGTTMKLKKRAILRIISLVMLVIAVIFVIFALNCP